MLRIRILLTACLLAEQVLVPAAFVFAQDEQSEAAPAENVAQAAPDEGGPILERPQAQEPPAEEVALPKTMPQAPLPGRPIPQGAAAEGVPMYKEVEAVSPMDRKIGPINLNNASISAFLHVITVQSGISFILSDGIEKSTLSVFLGKKISVRDALELLNTKGLTYQRVGKSQTYVVRRRTKETPNLITKVYVLNYIPLIKPATVGEALEAITSQDVSSGGMVQQDESKPGGGKRESTGIALLDIVNSILSSHGKMATDPRTNSLIITDVPEV
ncbi:MAG TPA: hypothetical protein PL037_07285, partial [Elusimicrobiales bacterium]|nr:hypothetical protein [Elusimicrobiales bacterium]